MTMRNLLALIGLAVVIFGGVGWYCGWYKLSVNRGQDGNLQISTEVDTHKVSEDSSSFFKKVGQMVGDKANNGQPSAPPVSTPGPLPSIPPVPTPPVNTGNPGNTDGTAAPSWFHLPSRPSGVGNQ
jgi:hypothetical protein